MASSRCRRAAIRPVGVLGSAVGHAALRMSSACAVASLSSSSTARWASFGSTVCAIRSIGQSVSPAVGFDASATGGASSIATPSVASPSRATPTTALRSDRGIGAAITECVSAEHAVVEVIVRIGPERVIGIGVERVIDEVIVGVGPEQWADPADYDRVGKMAPPLRVEEPALERRVRERARTGIAGILGKGLIAQDAA